MVELGGSIVRVGKDNSNVWEKRLVSSEGKH